MTIDIASLIFEIDSTQAVTARERLDDLEKAGARVDAAARKVKTATELAGIGIDKTASATGRATRAATEYAQSQGAAERAAMQAERAATRAAEREAAAWARVEAQLERRNAAYRGAQALAAMREEAAAAANLERRIDALMNSIDPTRAAQARLNAEMAEASALYKAGAISASDYAKAVSVLDNRMAATARQQGVINSLQGATAKGARLAGHEMANLGSQFADIGVSLASGQALWLVAIQQGAQIGGIYGQAASRGVTLTNVLGQLGGAVGSLVTKFGPLLVVTAAIGGAFALFEREVDKSTDQATTWGDTWRATLKVVGDMIMDGPIGDGLRWLGRSFGATLDAIVDGVMWWADKTVGHFGAAYELIVKNWRRLPEVFGVIVQGAANLTIQAVEGLVNKVIDGVNFLLEKAGKSALDHINLPEIRVANAKLTADYERMAKRIEGSFRAGRESVFDRIVNEADRLATARAKEEGATAKATKALRDHSAAANDNADAMARAAERSLSYAQSLEEQVFAFGKSEVEMLRWNVAMEAAAAPTEDLANRIREAGDQLIGLKQGQAAVEDLNKAFGEFISMPQPDFSRTSGRIEELRDQFEELVQKASDVRYGVDDIYYSIKNNDWAGAFAGLFRVLEQLKVAFTTNASLATKMGAIGGVAAGVGGAIGGRTGAAISGIGSGVAAGAMFGPWGAAIGGVIGGIASIFGGNKEKQRQKAQQEAADIANAQAIAQERANRQAELELRILELSGDEVGALARRREAELKAMDSANRALQEHVYALEDWAEAVAKAKDAVSKAEDDLRAAYEAERDRLQGIIDGVEAARDRLRDAYQRERSAIEGTISGIRSLVDILSDFQAELALASGNADLQYAEASRRFASATGEAIPEAGRTFLDASRETALTDLDFQRDLAAVRRKTDEAYATAQNQLTTAERQLAALEALVAPALAANDNLLSVEAALRGLTTAEQNAAIATAELARLDAQVGALITINTSVLSVAEAIANLQGALAAVAAAEAAKPSGGASKPAYEAVGYEGYVDRNPDLAALYASGSGMAAGRTKAELGAYHWNRYGQGEDRYYRPFARGGDHMGGLRLVGEEGPELELTGPSRIFSARQTEQMLRGDNSRLEALVEDLTKEVAAMRKERAEDGRQIKKNTKETADIMAKVTQGGDAVRTVAA